MCGSKSRPKSKAAPATRSCLASSVESRVTPAYGGLQSDTLSLRYEFYCWVKNCFGSVWCVTGSGGTIWMSFTSGQASSWETSAGSSPAGSGAAAFSSSLILFTAVIRTQYLESVFPAESFPAWQTIQTGKKQHYNETWSQKN